MKVVSHKNLPTRLPLGLTALVWLILDRLDVTDWVWGGIGALILILWIGAIYRKCREKQTDIF